MKIVMKIIKMRTTKAAKEILILFSIDKDKILLPYGIITLCGNGKIKFQISITILERFYISLFIPYLNAKRNSCSEKSTDSQIIKTFITCRLLLWVSFSVFHFLLLFLYFLKWDYGDFVVLWVCCISGDMIEDFFFVITARTFLKAHRLNGISDNRLDPFFADVLSCQKDCHDSYTRESDRNYLPIAFLKRIGSWIV